MTLAVPPASRLRQRSRPLQFIALGLIGLILVAISIDITSTYLERVAPSYGVALLFAAGSWWLARQHHIWAGTVLCFIALIGVLLITFINSDDRNRDLFILLPFCLLILPMTALLLGSRATIVSTIISLSFALLLFILPLGLVDLAINVITIVSAIATTGGITWFATRQLERSLAESELRAQALVDSEHQLQQQTSILHERTNEAEMRRLETMQTLAQLQTTISERDDLARSLQEATLPVLPVHKDIIVLPLIGSVDSARALLLTSTILTSIEQNHARAVIMDVTGVPVIDTQVAGALLHTAEAARLLGAYTVLVGIRPEVAQTLVGLGLSLNSVVVRADLQSGIQAAIKHIGASRN